METKQPTWKPVANLGDVDPVTYGGQFVYIDETGVYPPECEVIEPADEETARPYATVWRFILEPCTHIDGVLSDNKFHPTKPAWFADSLHQLAAFAGVTFESLVECLTSSDPVQRAHAWLEIGRYHGWQNLDSYPLEIETIEDARERYADDIKALRGNK